MVEEQVISLLAFHESKTAIRNQPLDLSLWHFCAPQIETNNPATRRAFRRGRALIGKSEQNAAMETGGQLERASDADFDLAGRPTWNRPTELLVSTHHERS
jgi:hypothetical protein